MTVMKKGTNTKMKYQQGQTRLSSQYAKRGVSKLTLRTFISLLPYQGADDLTFEGRGGGGGGVISGQQEFFFFANLFYPSHFSAGIFFPKKGSVQVFVNIYLHLHCGYCSNDPDMELQSLKILQAIQNHSGIVMFSERHSLH